ncbi:uncharacterized protein LOC8066345 [Sorghum bicolor]|uniref:Uncharacterized protein n=1 Tax=Sorghum bicolor TaxID=4558 RepID=A0A1B6PDB1_SORBI|nr:uncharacterized protein LOC8066345 [Sorghum bicolor]KXG23664.1 hypothetical protein SORBI_3008G124600 [Sorghum bicolor]|eukprot:XP_002442301.2 uncharacterized protein LOC8066345 [Sorghum bicolor]
MEGGGWAAGGGHVLGAAQEPRGEEEEEKEAGPAAERKKGSGGGGGGMKFRVRARAPHGVGALLLIGGAAVVGAAVLAWRRSRHGKTGAAVDQPERRLPAKQEALDGGVVEDGKVQGASLVQKLDQSDENLSVGNTDNGSGRLDGNDSEESHQIHKDDEITADQLESKHEERIDENSGTNPVEVHTHNLDSKHEEKIDEISGSNPVEVHTHDLDKEHVEEVDQKSSCNNVEITAHDMCQDNEHVEKIDHVEEIGLTSSRNPVKIIMQEMVNVCLVSGSVEKVEKGSSKKDIEKEIAQKDNKDMEASDQSKLCIKGPGIILSKHNDESDGTQEAESMENTPTAQLLHQDQLLDDMVTDAVTETEDTVTETEDTIAETEDTVTETEAKQGERTLTDESELEQDEKKDLVGLVELASSPALSSLVKPIAKKEPEFPTPNETGMKLDQDYTNGELREHTDLISKAGAMRGEGDMATMDCRSSALVVIALIFTLAMGITIIVRLYAPSRATKLQMDLP